MVDVKKLITGFLIVGSAAAGSGLILATINLPSASPVAAPQIAGVTSGTQSPVGENAFVQQADTQSGFPTIDTSAIPLANASSNDPKDNPSNLTDALAGAFMNGVAAANPSGPQTDDSGNPAIASPDTQAIAMAMASTTALNDLNVPDWNIEAESQAIKTTNDATSGSVSQYSNALNDIVSSHFIDTGIVAMVNAQNEDPAKAPYIRSQIAGALGDTLGLSVPAPLVNLQKSMVKVLVYEKNILALLNNVNNDPVKTSLILSDEENNYNTAVQDLSKQMQNAATVQGFSFGITPSGASGHNGAVALFDAVTGIKTAHAQWLTFDASSFGEWLLKFAKDIALQILKNTLMALIQKKVLAWVQGSGAPRFITNWATTFVNAYTQSALSAINSQMACVYPAFVPQLRLTLTAFYKPASNNVCANTFQAALGANTFQQFYNNFANGGWVAFGASMLPSGNYYDGLAFQAQVVDQTAQNQKQAAIQKATANNGLKGDEVCADGSNPNGDAAQCSAADGSNDYNVDPDCGTGKWDPASATCIDSNGDHVTPDNWGCAAGDRVVVEPNGGQCADGSEPTVTTPGTFTGLGVNSALDSSPKLVAAANDIVGLLNALASSLLSSLANTAINAATTAVNSGLNGGIASVPQSAIQGGGTSTAQTLALTCNPPTQNASTTFPVTFGAVGGTNDASGNPPNYFWSATTGDTGSGAIFSVSSSFPGTYIISLGDSTGDATTTCRVIVQ